MTIPIRFVSNAFIYLLFLNFSSCLEDVQSSVHLKLNNYGSRKLSCTSFQFQCKNEQVEGFFFQCDNGACIDEVHKCDGIEQCCDGSDEWAQTCEKYSVENRQKRAASGNCATPPSSPNRTIVYECDNGTSETCIINGLILEKTVAKVVCNTNHSAANETGNESICFKNKWYPDMKKCDENQSPENPCRPSPCGPFSQCREFHQQPVCSCIPSFIGSPPNCRPECVVNSDCARDFACRNQKCVDPCEGTCGLQAVCIVINHNPICSCPHRHTGDPFVHCFPTEVNSSPDQSTSSSPVPIHSTDSFLPD